MSARCRSCRAPLRETIIDLGEQPISDSLPAAGEPAGETRPLQVMVCTSCWLVQLDVLPVSVADRVGHGHGAAYSTTVQQHYRTWSQVIPPNLLSSGAGTVLDIQCGDGRLLAGIAPRVRRRIGFESDPTLGADADRLGVDVRPERFGRAGAQQLQNEGIHADLVLVNHAFAHSEDLDEVIGAIAAVLAPDGIVVVEFHHVLGLARSGQFDIACHAHLAYLSALSLQAALQRHGLSLVQAETQALHGGSVRALARRGRPSIAADSVRRVLAMERAARLDSMDGYRGVATTAVRTRDRLVAFLDEVSASGRTIAGYGAPSRGTTLLNFADITSAQLPFTVDKAPEKQGRVVPGCDIPVRHPDAITAARPDYVLILPWPLVDEITAQLALVRSWGGRFVVALPELAVIEDGISHPFSFRGDTGAAAGTVS
jgi:SAM-dependent methyltransferase